MFPTRKAAALCLLLSIIGANLFAQTITVVDGATTTVGFTSPTNNLLIIRNGGSANVSFNQLGSDNLLITTGTGSLIRNSLSLSASSNFFQFIDGGRPSGFVSFSGKSNVLAFENTAATNSSITFMGSAHSLSLSRGAQYFTGLGTFTGSGGHNIALDGAETFWTNSGAFDVWATTLRVNNGARFVTSAMSANQGSNSISVATYSELSIINTLTTGGQLSLSGDGIFRNGNAILAGTNIARETHWIISTNLTDQGSEPRTLLLVAGASLEVSNLNLKAISQIDVMGPGSRLSASKISIAGSQLPRFSISNGARLEADNVTNGNSLIAIDGPQSSWQTRSNVSTGDLQRGASFQVSGGAVATNTSTIVGLVSLEYSRASRFTTASSLVVTNPGSRWITGSNLYIGFNGIGNSAIIVDGGNISAQSLAVGIYAAPAPLSANFTGAAGNNSFLVSDSNSFVNIAEDIWVGYRSSTNTLTVERGSLVTGRNLTLGYSIPGLSEVYQSNIVRIAGSGSKLVVSSFFSFGRHILDLTDGGSLLAETVRLPFYVRVQGPDTELFATNSILFDGRQLGVYDGGRLTGNTIALGGLSAGSEVQFSGPGTSVRSSALDIRANLVDPFASTLQGIFNLIISNSAIVQVQSLRLGTFSKKSTNYVTVDGATLNIASVAKTGLLEIEHGVISVRNHATLNADKVRFIGTNAFLNFESFDMGSSPLARLSSASASALSHLGEIAITGRQPTANALITASVGANIGGKLSVTLDPTNIFQAGDSIVLLRSPSISGHFENVANGSRFATTYGEGTFLLKVEPTLITLADYQPGGQTDIRLQFGFDAIASALAMTFPSNASAYTILSSTNLMDWVEIVNPQFTITLDNNLRWTVPLDTNQPQSFFQLLKK
jgi:T5SS/PEP-CTERM-associated repeat protein